MWILHSLIKLFIHSFFQVFRANYDQTTSVTHHLTRAIYARFIRIHPREWSSSAGMRTEFLGCYVGKFEGARLLLIEVFIIF